MSTSLLKFAETVTRSLDEVNNKRKRRGVPMSISMD
jgi:hypothetical protein